jgi:hypothetical protein
MLKILKKIPKHALVIQKNINKQQVVSLTRIFLEAS